MAARSSVWLVAAGAFMASSLDWMSLSSSILARPRCRTKFSFGGRGFHVPETQPLWQLVADRRLDRDRLLHRLPRHHAVVMRGEVGEEVGRFVAADKAPIEAEEVDVGDRVAADRPVAVAEPSLGEAPYGVGLVGRQAPCRVQA